MQHTCCLDFALVIEQCTSRQNVVGTTSAFKLDQICAAGAVSLSAVALARCSHLCWHAGTGEMSEDGCSGTQT